jgi:hypothetical protein
LVAAFRKAELPIVLVRVNSAGAALLKSSKDSNSVRNIASPFGLTDNFADIVADIKMQPTDILSPKEHGMLFITRFYMMNCKKRYITGIVLAGVATRIGVKGIASAASELG